MKHAFTDTHKGVLRVQLKAGAAQQGVLTVQDNGVGLPTSIDWKKSSSLGFTIVNALARQIKGVLESTPQPQQGVGFTLTFPIPQTKQA
jgi:two-component sensor histidine kinase